MITVSTSFIKPDWHETEEAAIARADDMRVKRVESLKKQIAKLEKLKFGNAMPTRRQ